MKFQVGDLVLYQGQIKQIKRFKRKSIAVIADPGPKELFAWEVRVRALAKHQAPWLNTDFGWLKCILVA